MGIIDSLYQSMVLEAWQLPVKVCKRSSMSGSWLSISDYRERKVQELIVYEGDDNLIHVGLQSVEYSVSPRLIIALSNVIPYFPIRLFVKRKVARDFGTYETDVPETEIIDQLHKLMNEHMA